MNKSHEEFPAAKSPTLRRGLSIEDLRDLLEYDLNAGTLIWKQRLRFLFNSDRAHRRWNAQFAGKAALITKHSHGYRCGKILGVSIGAHVVLVALAIGRWPTEVDHINGIKHDNRRENLREVTKSGNMRNLPRRRRNKSGVTGVSWHTSCGRWRAKIRLGKREIFLGHFDTVSEAAAVRKAAEAKFGFHPNHGRAATC